MAQLVEHGGCNSRIVGMIPAGATHMRMFARITNLVKSVS